MTFSCCSASTPFRMPSSLVMTGSNFSAPQSGRALARNRASNDADVSIAPPKIPYGGFSPVRLQGWPTGGAFPCGVPVKPAPGIPVASVRFASVVCVLRRQFSIAALCRAGDSFGHCHASSFCCSTRGPWLQPGLFCPGPSSLIGPVRPTRGHAAISRHSRLYATPSLCGSA